MEEVIDDIIALGEELAGVPAGSFHWTSRKQSYQLCRATSSNIIMRQLGMDYNKLSKYINSRDRASFYFYYKEHDNNMRGWDAYRVLYNAIKSHWLSNDRKGGVFMDDAEFDIILYRNGIDKLIYGI